MGEPGEKATIGEVWAAIRATEEARRRGEEARHRGEEALKETLRKAEEARIEGEKALRESHLQTQKEVRETQQEIKQLNDSLKEANGNFNNKWGHFLENLLEGDLVKLLNGQNIKVEEVYPRFVVKRSGIVMGEYDLVAVNGQEVVVVEVKTTLEKDHVGRFLKKLAEFKEWVSIHKDKTLYGAVAYMSVKRKEEDQSKEFSKYATATEMAQEEGLFLIQSPGGAKDVSRIVNREGFRPREF